MSSFTGAKIENDNLVTLFDAKNRKSNVLTSPSLINPVWAAGSGSYSVYSMNGATSENERLIASDPWGNNAIVWETRPVGDNADDGGWNTSAFSIDRSKMYRFSVWVKRTTATSGGTFYFGTGSDGGVFSVTDNLEKGNPYWDCRGTGALTQNTWYLFVGHIFPNNTNVTTNHPDTGFYTVANGYIGGVNFCNIGSDLKWGPTSTSGWHRTYHYYCTDATTRLQFLSPRVDLCDGNELTIKELLTIPQYRWTDISGSGAHGVYSSTGTMPYVSNGEMILSSGNYMTIGMNRVATNSIGHTWEVVVKPNTATDAGIFGHVVSSGCSYYCNGGICIWNGKYAFNWYDNANYQFLDSGVAATGGQTAHVTAVYDGTLNVARIYVNGILRATSGTTNMNYGGNIYIGYVGYFSASGVTFSGSIQNIKYYYNKALSQSEILDNFNSLRSRFGI